MLATSASKPAIFSETMRRVRLENESVNRNCPARLSQLSGRCQPFRTGFSAATSSMAKDDVAFSAVSLESGCVRSSNRHPPAKPPTHPTPIGSRRQRAPRAPRLTCFLETVSDAVQRLDHLEIVAHHLELLAQPLDVAVDGSVVDIDLVVIGRVHQRVAALHHTRARRQRLQDQEL